jgi:hypothetical protein
MNPITKYIGITLAVFVAIAFLVLISEWRLGARLAQGALVIAILVVALRHESQILAFFNSVEGKPSA